MAVTVEMRTQVSQLYYALFGRAPDAEGLGYWVQQLSGGKTVVSVADDMFAVDAARAYYPAFSTNEELVESFYLNTLGRVADAEGLAYWTAALNAPGATPGSVITDLIYAVVGYSGTDAAALTSQQLFNNKVTVGQYYGENNGDIAGAASALVPVSADAASVANAIAAIDASGVANGLTFTLTEDTAAGADVMRLTGDMDVRIDLTANNNQVKGLDLDGDGVIEPNGVENNNPTTLDNGKDFEIVDAYSRDLLNQGNLSQNFAGDIAFDGTGFAGDGVDTDGNIFLGGLGADTALGGIGNDFLTGGGVADASRPSDVNENGIIEVGEVANFSDELFGGRNADFFFAELSLLDSTDGNNLTLHGGQTSDDAAVGNNTLQDSDWLLLEVSDDEDGTTISLTNETDLLTQQFVSTGAGQGILMDEIENVDASGNLYGFLNDVDVAIGGAGKVVNGENVAIGASAQLNIIGSAANNILIGGYDNDRIDGSTGDDLLMGGNLNYAFNNVNAAGIANNGMDELFGGAGDDNIVFEADSGIVDGGANNDTLWLTRESLGIVSAANASTLIEDGVVRIELENGDSDGNDTFAGTGGADVDGTADQTNYLDSDMRVNLDNMENVIATGLGAVDYKAAGSNDPDLNFNNQQNHFAYNGDLDLRGTGVASTTTEGTSVTELTVTVTSSVPVSITVQNIVQVINNINGEDVFAVGTETQTFTNVATEVTVAYAGVLSQSAAQARFVTENPGLAGIITDYANIDVFQSASFTTITSDGVNVLYAAGGADVLEGREGGTLTTNASGEVTADGRDKLSGGAQADDFIFALGNYGIADGVDVIHRQVDANADNLWDEDEDGNGLLGRDFALEGDQTTGASVLTVKIAKVGGNVAGDELDDVVNFVSEIVTGVKVGSAFTAVTLNTAEIKAAVTYQGLTDAINNALDATAFGADLQAALQADGITIFITDAQGRELADTTSEVAGAGVTVNQKANTQTENVFQYGEPEVTIIEDRLIYASYEDRSDNELVDDDSYTGSTISLGTDAYAEDLVVDFAADGTRIAEDQSYVLTFDNLTTEDTVEINVNGVKYSLRVGVDLDGNEIAGEELTTQGGNAGSQEAIQAAFLVRMEGFINTFMDDDTAAGQVTAEATATTLTLTQEVYNGEETVFMSTPTVVLGNQSTGEKASVTVLNNSQHEVHLLDFDGRDGALNEENVLFIGNMGVDFSRATLETGEGAAGTTNTMNSSEAMIVDGGSNTLQSVVFGSTQAIADNTATNAALRTDFTVHGDDLLITGVANDIVNAGTGDDRVIGSLGADTLDGGKSYYAVQVLGEAQARVYVLNQWEAQNPTLVTALQTLTISSINRVGDAETGNTTPVSAGTTEVYNDTLQFQQGDFSANTNFTVTLDGFTGATAATVQFRNGGAGHVAVDDAGNGTTDATSTFTNFENIRTVSGTGNAVANDGQGNDTLNVAALSAAAGGISYDLTSNVGTAGDVRYSANASINQLALAAGQAASVLVGATVASVKAAIVGAQETVAFQNAVNAIPVTGATTIAGFLASVSALALLSRPTSLTDALTAGAATDYETQVIKVDGVENVVGGTGNDLLLIDHSEAAKNNSFTAGLGNDRIEYQNDYNTAATRDMDGDLDVDAADQLIAEDFSEATVTIKLDNIAAVTSAATGTDTVTMTSGRVGTTVAVDSLTAVERISLGGNTAEGRAEADVIDVTAMTTGAIVDYTNGQVRDLTGTVHVTVEGIVDIETVWADGNDTVIVANSTVMATNAREDVANGTADQNILFMNYLDFNDLNTNLTTRKTFAAQVADDTIMNVVNQGEFTFSLSKVGTDVDTDRVDYSAELGRIIAAVGQGSATTPQYIIVDGDSDDDWTDATSRVDVLESVEEIVASLGESVLDFTTVNAARQITFQYQLANAAVPAEGAEFESIVRIADGSGNVIQGLSAFVERYTFDGADGFEAGEEDVTWNRIEGSDANESVRYEGSENLVTQYGLDHRYSDDTLNLRGGDNGVSYTAIETSITVDITVVEDTGTGNGIITADIDFQDGNSGALANAGQHTVTSYGADNTIAGGTLKIEASQDAEDTVSFNTASDKVFLLGVSAGVLNVDIGTENSMILTGFEILIDADSDDVYDMADLETVQLGMELVDNIVAGVTADRDTIKVGDDAIDYDGGFVALDTNAADTINLEVLNDVFHFDFDVLDITNVTDGDLIIVGDDDDQDNDATLNTADAQYVWGPDGVIVAGGSDMARDLTDDIVIGSVDLIDSINGFANIWLTNASITSAGSVYELDIDAGELVSNNVTNLITDSRGLNFSLVTTAVAVSVTDIAQAGAVVVGTALADDITGGAGADTITGGAGADVLDGNIVPEVQEVQQVIITGGFGVDASNDGTIEIGGITLTEAAAAVAGVSVVDGSSNLQIGNAFAAIADSVWETALGLNVGELDDVSFDNGTGALTFTFAAGFNAVDGSVLAASGGYVAGTDTGAIVVGAGTDVAYAPQGESADTFVFEALTDSTAAAMDEISNFSVGAVDDVIDLSGVGLVPHPLDVVNGGSGYANYAAILADAADQMDNNDANVFVGSDGIDTWVFVAEDSHDASVDMVIKLVGIDATGIDFNNFTA